ncbi:MAG: 50S ribosomal protein L11 methyltransferase [Caldilineales bacterium]|nr:50S ribosomal protein L11 methyltransferase [Caldilineales bacterium]MDW8317541.1 50S ribosomal protein L11 methyltransferase [Anaerolineae bacterium]
MKWLEISVQCDGEAAEAVSELFNRFNSAPGEAQGGAVVELTGYDARGELTQPVLTVRTYLPLGDLPDERRRKIEEGLWFLSRLYPLPEPTYRELDFDDWAHAWRSHYRPIPVGRRLLIVPAWQADSVQPEAGRLPVILDPGLAFGTGLHPTTRLCMAALERYVQPGDAVLDIGSGSGVLSIAAARLGASTVLATDLDPNAVAATRSNSELNGVGHIVQVRQGSLPDPQERPERWQVIVANILAETIVELLDQGLWRLMAVGGRLILSGIIGLREDLVLAALDRYALRVVERTAEGEWVCLVARL